MTRLAFLSVAVALCLLASLPVESASPFQQQLNQIKAGLSSNKYYAGLQARLQRLHANYVKNKVKRFVLKKAADKMANYKGLKTVISCPMSGRDLNGKLVGQDHAFGVYFIFIYKRADGDYDGYYGGFVKLGDPEIPIAAAINSGMAGEDGSTVIDFGAEVTWINASRSSSLGLISWFPGSSAPLGYNYVFRGSWSAMSLLSSADGSTMFDTIDAVAKSTQTYYGVVANSNYATAAARGQCGLDFSGITGN
ncbi:hypothetical protein CLOM_g1552 [Closterium sp. NIES-68]|nr:hypothetical protein CLOM_g1552 [Closterium sp. NIES-68]GJP81595.1 hypothetical protein CLOP_g11738 [Closterium sp. NIES-67]GJP85947.1 hypothetical protein CLOP_g16034 [Closterium sp. NIES-67]